MLWCRPTEVAESIPDSGVGYAGDEAIKVRHVTGGSSVPAVTMDEHNPRRTDAKAMFHGINCCGQQNAMDGDEVYDEPPEFKDEANPTPKLARLRTQPSVLTMRDFEIVEEEGPDPGDDRSEGSAAEDVIRKYSVSSNNGFLTSTAMKGIVAKFRQSVHAMVAPSKIERSRGVRIDRVYDFFDPVAKKTTVCKIKQDVLNKRTGVRSSVANAQATEAQAPGDACSSGSVSPTSSPPPSPKSTVRGANKNFAVPEPVKESKPAKKVSLDKKCIDKRAVPTAAGQQGKEDVVSMWGLLVARIIKANPFEIVQLAARLHEHDWVNKRAAEGKNHHTVPNIVVKRALGVLKSTKEIAKAIKAEQVDRMDCEWQDSAVIMKMLGKEFTDTLCLLSKATRKVLAEQPSLAEVEVPCRIIGDLHGQLRSLLMYFGTYGFPNPDEGPVFIFNGAFTGKGKHKLEVLTLLMALKLVMPDKVYLIRGCHESRSFTEKQGLKQQIAMFLGSEWGPTIYESVCNIYEQLPVACLISDRILVVPGGIGDGNWSISELRKVNRPLTEEHLAEASNQWLNHLVSSQPIPDKNANLIGTRHKQVGDTVVVEFGWDITKAFCTKNGLSCVVRSGQNVAGSLGFDALHNKALVRVFSARDNDGHVNDGATLLISPPADDSPDSLITIRPQVLRSVVKGRRAGITKPPRLAQKKHAADASPAAKQDIDVEEAVRSKSKASTVPREFTAESQKSPTSSCAPTSADLDPNFSGPGHTSRDWSMMTSSGSSVPRQISGDEASAPKATGSVAPTAKKRAKDKVDSQSSSPKSSPRSSRVSSPRSSPVGSPRSSRVNSPPPGKSKAEAARASSRASRVSSSPGSAKSDTPSRRKSKPLPKNGSRLQQLQNWNRDEASAARSNGVE